MESFLEQEATTGSEEMMMMEIQQQQDAAAAAAGQRKLIDTTDQPANKRRRSSKGSGGQVRDETRLWPWQSRDERFSHELGLVVFAGLFQRLLLLDLPQGGRGHLLRDLSQGVPPQVHPTRGSPNRGLGVPGMRTHYDGRKHGHQVRISCVTDISLWAGNVLCIFLTDLAQCAYSTWTSSAPCSSTRSCE